MSINARDKATITRDLQRANALLTSTANKLAFAGEHDLARALRDCSKDVAGCVTVINGGPVKLHVSEMMGGAS